MTAKLQTEILFNAPTTLADGTTPIPAGLALSYTALIDTVNPPVKSYTVPAANAPSGPGAAATVTFAELGFTPVLFTTYYATVYATDPAGNGLDAPVVTFTYELPPAAPTGFTVG